MFFYMETTHIQRTAPTKFILKVSPKVLQTTHIQRTNHCPCVIAWRYLSVTRRKPIVDRLAKPIYRQASQKSLVLQLSLGGTNTTVRHHTLLVPLSTQLLPSGIVLIARRQVLKDPSIFRSSRLAAHTSPLSATLVQRVYQLFFTTANSKFIQAPQHATQSLVKHKASFTS